MLGCAVLAGLLAGCGGGAGVDFGDPDEERINRGNALEVARLVVGRSMDSVALVALVGQGLVEPVLDPDRAGDFDNAVPTFKCENARTGTVSVTLNDLDNDDLVSEQDTASLSYGNCRDLLLERTLDGTTTDPEAAVVARLEGAAGSNLVPLAPWAIGVDMEMGGLGLTGPDGAGTQLTGLLSTTQRSQDGALIVMETNTVRFTFGDATVGEDVLRNAQTRFQEDNRLTTPTFEVRMEGEVSSTRLGGAFRFETVAPLQGSLGEVPAAGSLRVLGDGNTTMLIRVPLSGGAEVELLVDEDGDGNFDNPDPAPIPITWRQLNFF